MIAEVAAANPGMEMNSKSASGSDLLMQLLALKALADKIGEGKEGEKPKVTSAEAAHLSTLVQFVIFVG